LTSKHLCDWRDDLLAAGMKRQTFNRLRNNIRAILSFAARKDRRIKNGSEWDKDNFPRLPNATVSRNVVLADQDIGRFIDAAYDLARPLGVLADVMAVTGARPSQIARLRVDDLKAANTDRPYLRMPRGGKGGGTAETRAAKKMERFDVQITPALAATLKCEAGTRPKDAPLLTRSTGLHWGNEPWGTPDSDDGMANHYGPLVKDVVAKLGLTSDEGDVTLYALRHSSITRLLLAGKSDVMVAKVHDTSPQMIRQHYAHRLDKHIGDSIRDALFVRPDPVPPVGNVMPLPLAA
jgi:integrase